jgi:hypothetical protein
MKPPPPSSASQNQNDIYNDLTYSRHEAYGTIKSVEDALEAVKQRGKSSISSQEKSPGQKGQNSPDRLSTMH